MLQKYADNGFKFIHCNSDKSPKKKWRDTANHLSLEVAIELQKTGEMIGAIIPDDICILDFDRHEGKPDGVESYKRIKDKYGITTNIVNETFTVETMSGGYHVFFYLGKDHGLIQGEKAPGIDLKTGAGYVIAAGSPGYKIHNQIVLLKKWVDTVCLSLYL